MKLSKILALVLVLCLALSLTAFASGEASDEASSEASGEASSEASAESASEPVERPDPEVVEGERYVSDYLNGASAIYVSGDSVTLDDAYFYGAGYATSEEITDQIPNQFGLCAVVLACGEGTELVLNNPTIQSDPESYANGVFSAAMAKVVINGGTITTNNSSGHGIDTTYMGKVYAYDTVIHTSGGTSGAIASDFGGGFVIGERIDATTDGGASPGIFCAGSTIIMLTDSKLTANGGTGVVVAHDHAVVVLNNCELSSSGTAISGLQALPSPASSDGSKFYAFGGSINSNGGLISEGGGRTEVNIIGTECTQASETAISCSSGIMTVNLWDTEITGNVTCSDGCTLVVNLYDGAKLTGEVTGDVELNVYDGGEYVGSYAANEAGAGEEAPVAGSFDDYLLEWWAAGSMTWTESRAQDYVETIESKIIENSAASYVVDGASSKPYDAETFDPSENGVDLDVLNSREAWGFTVEEISGGSSGEASGSSGEASGSSGEASASAE